VLLATAPPYSSLMLVRSLARALGKPYVVDLRDLWTLNLVFRQSGFRAGLSRLFERRVFADACAVVVNTLEAQLEYQLTFPQWAEKIVVIPNGFDSLSEVTMAPADGPLRIVHAGTLAGTRVDSVRTVLDASLILERERGDASVRIEFLGSIGDEAAHLLSTHPASRMVVRKGFVSHLESLAAMRTADVLLLAANTEQRTALHVPAKLYEYLSARRPILAITGPGGIERMLSETGAGRSVAPGDVETCIEVLHNLLASKRASTLGLANSARALETYSWGAQANRLDAVLSQAAELGAVR